MIAAVKAWLAGARWRASLLHLGEMWVVWLPVYLLTDSRIAGAAAVIGWYWARKQTETRAATAPYRDLLAATNPGWFPWQWWAVSPYLVLDFAVPAVASLLLILAS
jgi:hypothetical protein